LYIIFSDAEGLETKPRHDSKLCKSQKVQGVYLVAKVKSLEEIPNIPLVGGVLGSQGKTEGRAEIGV